MKIKKTTPIAIIPQIKTILFVARLIQSMSFLLYASLYAAQNGVVNMPNITITKPNNLYAILYGTTFSGPYSLDIINKSVIVKIKEAICKKKNCTP